MVATDDTILRRLVGSTVLAFLAVVVVAAAEVVSIPTKSKAATFDRRDSLIEVQYQIPSSLLDGRRGDKIRDS